MDPDQRLQLQKMVEANGAADNSEKIRRLKHSSQIEGDVKTLIALKNSHSRLAKTNWSQFDMMCTSRCNFLFTNYPDIYNRVMKNELDLNILARFIMVLKKIESGAVGQHEASVEIGTILKELYIDSALKKSEKLDKRSSEPSSNTKKGRNISWKQFAAMNNE